MVTTRSGGKGDLHLRKGDQRRTAAKPSSNRITKKNRHTSNPSAKAARKATIASPEPHKRDFRPHKTSEISSAADPANQPAFSTASHHLALSTLHTLLRPIAYPKTICPSQIARTMFTSEDEWRAAMPDVRSVVWEAEQKGWVEVCQRGERRRYEDWQKGKVRGPLRVRKGEKFEGMAECLGSMEE